MGKDFRVEFYPQVGGNVDGFECEYETMEEAVSVLNAIAHYTLLLHDTNLMSDYSNMGMIFKKEASGWIEIDDDGIEI